MIKTKLPKWASLDRRNALVKLFVSSGGFCVFGHKKCLIASHHYTVYIEALIKDWKQLDREQEIAEWQAERQVMHSLGESPYPVTGRFNAISRDIYHANQPLYFLEGQAVSGLTLQPFVRVRIASSYVRLYIDLSQVFELVSKSKRRKAIRYGRPLPQEATVLIRRLVFEAVKHYLAH